MTDMMKQPMSLDGAAGGQRSAEPREFGSTVKVRWSSMLYFVLFFFFQAEDGIRDLTVTGVQTCALPISVYVAYFGWRSFSGGIAVSDVVVVRDDVGASGSNSFQALTDTDGLPGRQVVRNITIPFSNAPTLGQERIGSTLSIAVDPNNSGTVYLAWADRVGTGDIYTIHVRRSTDRGATWSGDLRTITNATCVF